MTLGDTTEELPPEISPDFSPVLSLSPSVGSSGDSSGVGQSCCSWLWEGSSRKRKPVLPFALSGLVLFAAWCWARRRAAASGAISEERQTPCPQSFLQCCGGASRQNWPEKPSCKPSAQQITSQSYPARAVVGSRAGTVRSTVHPADCLCAQISAPSGLTLAPARIGAGST